MRLAPGDHVDRYVVEAFLGEGGMASVYRVRHVELGTLHALKVLGIRAPGIAERTLQEGRIQATIRHENLVAVTDALRHDGAPALVLEYVDGPTLQALITRHPPHLAQIDDLAHGILRGVAYAHAHGLVHRDLKPANVLISTSGGRIVPKVADFGMAKVLDDTLRREGSETRSGIGLGTPTWMAPEQFRDAKTVDARADVFALGAVLYTLITGTPPFTGTDIIALLDAMRAKAWRPVREWSPSVPARWERAIEAALEPDPDRRPKDVAALLDLWDAGGAAPAATGDLWEPEQIERIRTLGADVAFPTMESVAPTMDVVPQTDSRRPTLAPPERGGWVLGGLILRASALCLAVLLAVAIGLATRRVASAPLASAEPSPMEPVAAPGPAAVVPPDPAPIVPVPSGREESRPSHPDPLPRPVAAPFPAIAPDPAPSTAPAPAPSADAASVTVVGAERAWLTDPSGARREPGEIPPGRHTLWVFFDATGPTAVLDLDLAAGDRRTVKCVAAMRTCR